MSQGSISTAPSPVPAFPVAPARPAVLRLGGLALASRYTLAPLAGYTGLAFRRAVPMSRTPGIADSSSVP